MNKQQRLKIVVLMGGGSAEHEISLLSGKQVIANLDRKKYQAIPVVIPQNFSSSFKYSLPKCDLVFIAMHGPFGEDGTVQGMLDFMGIPYTGSKVLASALGIDKIAFRRIMENLGIPVPKWVVCETSEKIPHKIEQFGPPWVVKPFNQGSSIGVNIVKERTGLKPAIKKALKYSKMALIEEYLAGTEISCGVLGNEKPYSLPVIEICPKKTFFDYQAKYTKGLCEEIVPARLPRELTKKIQRTAVKVFRAIGCRGFGRVDMIIKEDTPYVLEINTIPGLTPNSLLPKEALAAGIDYPKLLDLIIGFTLSEK
ncbi:MAG: D-alanine--D-alanine ligase [Patescibacteria group bacterium]|nr:D-alanine--D-alanine ligase [Patescibacteria group bacterium]